MKMLMLTMNPNKDKEDRISELPDHIIHNILRFIPIRTAAQTMILSHRWKNVFSSIPDLDFTTIHVSPPPFNFMANDRDINFLTNTLSLRDNSFTIRTLKLKSSQLSCMAFNFIMKYPKFIDIEELDVRVQDTHYFNIPWSIIRRVRVLKLNIMFLHFDRLIIPSLMKREFKFLHTMILHQVSFLLLFHDKHVFTDTLFPCLKKLRMEWCFRVQELTLRCSGLKDFIIKNCCDLNELDIYGLNLERLKVKNCFEDFSDHTKVKIIAPVLKVLKWVNVHSTRTSFHLEKSYLLEKVIISLLYKANLIPPKHVQELSNMMNALSHARFLKFNYASIEVFSLNEFILENKFENLRTLEITLEYSDLNGYNNFLVIATLLKNSPYLDTLGITIDRIYTGCHKCQMNDLNNDKYWEEQLPEMHSFLNHIRKVKLDVIFESYEDNISLAKFLLKNGKVLEQMVLCIELNTLLELARYKLMMSDLMKCSWASSKAKKRAVFSTSLLVSVTVIEKPVTDKASVKTFGEGYL
ncbi:putative F-box/FBD/LRR-repeat protein At4g03220 [Impatiens glandulifera]|uniref:putative F-box/FBD/LRR-repeat protein At4g03220 n=1 Tax=Impatiens glandulifera TaxID=253017 RepID=UPI001FB17C8D|nr:putative F-box/FBD/LRR-repeat protein At4g03220 [Impatiens glandulifera]